MNCDKCLELMDDLLDGRLSAPEQAAVNEHFTRCAACLRLLSDVQTILQTCEETREHLETPPNPHALWLRISNTIECEQSILVAAEPRVGSVVVAPQAPWFSRRFQLSYQQTLAAAFGIAFITSLLTFVAVQNAARLQENALNSQSIGGALPSFYGKNLSNSKNIELENRLRQQQLAIDYWNRRVEARRAQWSKSMREAFDRNLATINAVVADYQQQLQSDPDDRISEEMLDSAMNDKMQLLREFSEL
jgi:hypothetical protein